MSDEFRRLLDAPSVTPLHRVLETGLRDQPSKKDLARAAQILGIGATGLGVAQSAAAVETARALHGSLWAALAKWGGVGFLVGGVALAPIALRTFEVSHDAKPHLTSLSHVPAPARTPTPSSVAPEAPGRVLTPLVTPSQPTIGLKQTGEERTSREPRPVEAPPMRSSASSVGGELTPSVPSVKSFPSAPASDLDAEIALLDAARRALKSTGPSAALALLDRHDQLRAPSLDAEATLLRVRALMAAGRVAEARAIARHALTGTNASAYAARLSQLARLTP